MQLNSFNLAADGGSHIDMLDDAGPLGGRISRTLEFEGLRHFSQGFQRSPLALSHVNPPITTDADHIQLDVLVPIAANMFPDYFAFAVILHQRLLAELLKALAEIGVQLRLYAL